MSHVDPRRSVYAARRLQLVLALMIVWDAIAASDIKLEGMVLPLVVSAVLLVLLPTLMPRGGELPA